jgi:hypothetical protein
MGMSKSLLLQLTKVVFKARLFWPIWIATTVTAAVSVARMVGHAAPPIDREAEKVAIARKPRYAWSRGAIVALALLALFLVGDIVLTLTWEDFAYSDNSMFTLGTLKGHDLGPPIWRQNGRFFPLGHQEFDLIRHFTSTVAGYHALPILQLLVLCGILLILDEELSITARVGLTALALVSPALVTSYGGLIYTERNVVLWLACLVLCIKRFEQTHATAWAVSAVVCAQFMIYYKETAFLLLLGLALGRLVLRCKNADQSGWDYKRLGDKESRLDLCLVFLGALFVLNYWAAMLPHQHLQQYTHDYGLPAAEVVLAYFKLDGLAWLFVAVVLGRVHLILRHRALPLPLWDGLAFGGVACFAAYLYLGMFSAYYLAPVDLIAVLYVGRFAILSWGQRGLGSKVAITVLLGAVLFQDLALSAFRVFERKNVIHGKAEIARVIKAQFRSGTENRRRVFFPFARPYNVMEFASYLSYRGFAVEGLPVQSDSMNAVVLVGRAVAKDGPCVDYEKLVCHAATSPDAGDLVITLPDDDASFAEAAPYRSEGELLFSYEPRPRIPQWLIPFVGHLHVASNDFVQKKLPDRWLHASVTAW